MTPAPLTPIIAGHAAHSRADDQPSPPAVMTSKIRFSLSSAIQNQQPGRDIWTLPAAAR
jgi:hypothetical protein